MKTGHPHFASDRTEERYETGISEKNTTTVSAAKKEIESEQPAAVASANADEHRLLSYFTSPDDKKKLTDLVGQTLKKDMTYAQVTKFLVEKMGKEGGKKYQRTTLACQRFYPLLQAKILIYVAADQLERALRGMALYKRHAPCCCR